LLCVRVLLKKKEKFEKLACFAKKKEDIRFNLAFLKKFG
jgi:hypothetical protein